MNTPAVQPVAPIVYAVTSNYAEDAPGQTELVYGTVRREVQSETHVIYVIRNRMGAELIIDADSVNALITALTHCVAK